MKGDTSAWQDHTPQLLQAYERAVDENIISSITDTKGVIVYANAKFCETSQYPESELVGQNHRIVNSRFHSKDFFRTMWETLSRGDVWHDEIRNQAKDGTFYWVDTVIVPVKGEDQVTTRYLSLRTLITARKLLESVQASHLSSLQALLVMTSQKVRRPLASSLAQMDRLDARQPPEGAELAAIVAGLRASAGELDRFTTGLASFIRDMTV